MLTVNSFDVYQLLHIWANLKSAAFLTFKICNMFIEDIQEYCRRALRGDEAALQQLGLANLSYPQPKPSNLSDASLQITYNSVLTTAAAARELQLGFFQKQCDLTLELVKAIAVANKIELEHVVNAQDVAEVMLALIDDDTSRHNNKEVPEGQSDQELQAQPTPPAGDQNSDEQPTKTAPGRSTADGQPPASSTAHELSATSAKKQQPTATPAAPHSYASATSKNKRRQCPLCPFFGTHLDRHIAKKHPDAAESRSERVALLHEHDKLSTDQKGWRHVSRFQCTFNNCGAIITRLGQHLTRVHKLSDREELKKIKSSCRRLLSASSQQPKRKAPVVSLKRPKKKPRLASTTSSSSSEDESFISDGSTSQEHPEVDHHQLKVDADVDDISSFAETDEEDQGTISATEQKKWADIYLAQNENRNVREYFVSRFFKYLLHVEGGAHSKRQALLHTRQVHTIMETLEPEGTDLACLAKRGGVDIWDKFCLPKLKNKELTGNSLKVYLQSMEFFVKFIPKGLLYKKDMLNQRHQHFILALRDRLPDYRATIHRRTGHQTTTRKVDEASARLTPADLRQLQVSEPVKNAIKLIGQAAEKKALTHNEFILVRDYLLVTTLYENGSRPGPIENCLISRLQQATYSSENDSYTILVDKHKTTRHHGPAELTVTSRIYSYLQIYLLDIRPKFAVGGEEALFIKDDGHAFTPGTIGKRVSRFFELAGIRLDRRVTATTIRKMMSDNTYELSPTKKRLIHGHMKHSEKTADSNYVIRVNAERASKAHELMQTIIAQTTPHETSAVPSVLPETEKVPAAEESESDDDNLPLSAVFTKQQKAIPVSNESNSESAIE